MEIFYAGTAVFLTVATLVSGCATNDARYAYPDARYQTDTRYGERDGGKQQEPRSISVRIRTEGGAYQTFMQASLGGLRVGDRVRVENDRVSRY